MKLVENEKVIVNGLEKTLAQFPKFQLNVIFTDSKRPCFSNSVRPAGVEGCVLKIQPQNINTYISQNGLLSFLNPKFKHLVIKKVCSESSLCFSDNTLNPCKGTLTDKQTDKT